MHVCVKTLDDVDELRSVSEGREEQAVGLDDVADDGDTGAPELVLVGIPGLDDAGLALDAVGGL